MEVKNGEGPGMASKRGSDLAVTATIELKKQKLEIPGGGEGEKILETLGEEQIVTETAAKSEKVVVVEEEEQEAVEEAKVESEEDGNSNGKAVIDRKGKGILIEEEEDDEEEEDGDDSDSDDSSDGGNVSQDGGDDSDFSDDPLAEVDLDNILPSRTRRRVVHPSAYIASDLGGAIVDDDSDDSDA